MLMARGPGGPDVLWRTPPLPERPFFMSE
jgi:hypothetical protein